MEYLATALGAVVLVTLAVWWFGRKQPLSDDQLPWEKQAKKRQAASVSAEPDAPPPPEEVIPEQPQAAVRKLRSDVPMVVAEGARELGRNAHPDAASLLAHALGNEQRTALFAVVEALLALRAHAAGPLREAAASDRDPVIRERAGLVAGQIERLERGEPPTPLEDLLALSDKQREEMVRDLDRG